MTHDKSVEVIYDEEFSWYFFSCELCPLVIPFLKYKTAQSYSQGHALNSYHKRRLELLR